jgi:hypothetical protein
VFDNFQFQDNTNDPNEALRRMLHSQRSASMRQGVQGLQSMAGVQRVEPVQPMQGVEPVARPYFPSFGGY